MLRSLLEELRSLDSSRRSLRSFGLVMGGIAVIIAAWLAWRSGSLEWSRQGAVQPASIIGLIGLALVIIALVWPRPLLPLYYVWMALALVLGMVMTRVILTTVFVLLIIPIGVVMRLSGRDPLSRRMDAPGASYWISRDDIDRTPDRLEKYY